MSMLITFKDKYTEFNHQFTYNFSRMFDKLGCYDAILEIKENTRACDIVEQVRNAWVLLPRLWDELEDLEHKEGWGTRAQAMEFLGKFLIDLERHPNCFLHFYG